MSDWPKKLMLYVHNDGDEDEGARTQVEAMGLDPSEGPGREAVNAAYEHKMTYDVYEDGRTVLVAVDDRKVVV